MCLTQISSEKSRDKFLKDARRRGYIRVYKVCTFHWTGWCFQRGYNDGLQRAGNYNRKDVNYGFHAHLTLVVAERSVRNLKAWSGNDFYIKVCYAKPQWLKGLSLRTKEASFTHLVFPNWDKGNMTIREFRAVCRESTV